MATGKSSNLGASSSTKTARQEEKRKQCATRPEEAKKPRPFQFQLINVTAHPRGSGTAVPVVVPPLHCAASNTMATVAFPFPMAGVNGAAPLWSTAATLGAASRAAALTLSSMPATAAGANGPAAAPFVLAPAPGLQPPPGAAASNSAAAAAALPLPVASAATGVRPPLVLAQQAGEASHQFVPLPLHFVGYHPTTGGVVSGLPTPAIGIPLAAALDKIDNGALGRMLSALMPVCHPPLRLHQSKKTGAPPPWWPTGSEDWWVPELLAHLDTVAALMHAPAPVPFAPGYSLKKAQKVAVLVAIVKHLAPDFARIAAAVRHSGKLSVSETDLWYSALNNERAKCMRPVFILLPQPEQEPQQQGDGGGDSASSTPSAGAAGSVAVVHSGSAASDGCEQVASLPAGASASLSAAPADGSRGEVIVAAELVEKEPQRGDSDSDGDGGGVVPAGDAPAGGDGRDQRPANFPVGDGSTHNNKQGAAVGAAAQAGHDRQVVEGGAPEMVIMQPEQEQHGGVPPGDDGVAAAAEDDQVQVHPVVDVEGHQWWHNTEELNRIFAEFESFGDDLWY